MKNRKAFVYAYTKCNLGDDLFIKILCERYPHTKFYIISDRKFSEPLKKNPNLIVIYRIPKIDGLLKKLNINVSINNVLSRFLSMYCNAIIHIGGSIFIQNPEEWKSTLNLYRRRILKNKNFHILGSNFGPYMDKEFVEEYRRLFSDIKDVCFRDQYSYSLFKEMQNVRNEHDIVFSLSAAENETIREKKQVAISIINLHNRKTLSKYEENYYIKIIEIIRFFSRSGYRVLLMSFCKQEGDEDAINDIMHNLDDKCKEMTQSYFYSGDIDEALFKIKESKYVIGSRFHAMILGWTFNKLTYPIVYSDKSINVMEDIGFGGRYEMIQNIENMKVDHIIEDLEDSEVPDIKTLSESAVKHFMYLDRELY